MAKPQQLAGIFDEWQATLSARQKKVTERAIRNAVANLENVGEMSAKELIISVLLFCDTKYPQQNQVSQGGRMADYSVERIRGLKGAPLSVFVLLQMAKMPVNQVWLGRNSGYSDKSITEAVLYLEQIGWIVRTSFGWQLAEQVRLELAENLSAAEPASDTEFPESRNDSDSDPIIITNDFKDSELNNNNTTTTTPDRNLSDPDKDNPIWDELRRVGVYRNTRTQKMIRLPHVTLEYVRDLADQMDDDKKGGGQWSGLFIKLCERAEPIRETNPYANNHDAECDCNQCQVKRAVEYSRKNRRRL